MEIGLQGQTTAASCEADEENAQEQGEAMQEAINEMGGAEAGSEMNF